MPHLVLAGGVDLERALGGLETEVWRWGRAVLKRDKVWFRADQAAALVEGVVVEHSRPLHPVALIAPHHGDTVVRLWQVAPVERTPAVQRWLALVAADLRKQGAGPLLATNLTGELLEDLQLSD
ncbi:MAG: hypothetical protein KAJ97_02275 [Acidobacteria bacterium]|nr:hypothetical protein [Acidobacteriota bacterium]